MIILKKLLFFLFFVIAANILISCSKDSITKKIEGTWGLIQYDYFSKVEDEIMSQRKGECDPYNPKDDNDIKFTIVKDSGDDYSVTIYHWNNKIYDWVSDPSDDRRTWTIIGDKAYYVWNSETEDPVLFQLDTDRLIIEGYYYGEDDGYKFGMTGRVKYVLYDKYIFIKMSDSF